MGGRGFEGRGCRPDVGVGGLRLISGVHVALLLVCMTSSFNPTYPR